MSSIRSIHSSSMVSYKKEELSALTKLRLEALGIDPSSVSTESQAQILIAQAEAVPKQNGLEKKQGGISTGEQLISEARELARNTGTLYSNQDTLETLLEKISETLHVMAKNPLNADKVQVYQAELKEIAQRADIIINIQQNIFERMNMVSISNRIILGL